MVFGEFSILILGKHGDLACTLLISTEMDLRLGIGARRMTRHTSWQDTDWSSSSHKAYQNEDGWNAQYEESGPLHSSYAASQYQPRTRPTRDVSTRRRYARADYSQPSAIESQAVPIFTGAWNSVQRSQPQRRKRRFSFLSMLPKKTRTFIIIMVLFSMLMPTGITVLAGINEAVTIKSVLSQAISEIKSIQTTINNASHALPPGSTASDHAKAILQPAVLTQIRLHSQNAERDFQQLNQIFAQRQGVLIFAGVTPFSNDIDAAAHLTQAGVDIAQIGAIFAQYGQILQPIFESDPFFAGTGKGKPILTPLDYNSILQFLYAISPAFSDAKQQMQHVNLSSLPLSASQRKQISEATTLLPFLANGLDLVVHNSDAFRWLLGIDSPRTFLVQTMDSGELRATGGFTGQFGTLNINGARTGSISLTDVATLDFAPNNGALLAPQPYAVWWPESQWGLRDANLSGDFPTSARMAIATFKREGGGTVDGIIAFSSTIIQHLLQDNILGAVTVPCYNVSVTAQNLDDLIHYYQLGNGVSQQLKCTSETQTTVRKRFTAALAQTVQDKMKSAPSTIQIKAIQSLLTDLQNKEIEIYFTDPQAEHMLTDNHMDSSLIANPKQDATSIIQMNIAANKGSIYVTTGIKETITLNTDGSARHDLSLTLTYNPIGNMYPSVSLAGPSVTMRDYLRVYVPPNAQLNSGSGFDQTHTVPLCSGQCTPKQAPVCQATSTNPHGIFDPGAIPYSFPRLEGSGRDSRGNFYTDAIAGPTDFTSDVQGRTLFGGLIVIPSHCTATVTLSWTVTHAFTPGSPYTFIMQRQSDTNNAVSLAIVPGKGMRFAAVQSHINALQRDQYWSVPTR